MSETRNIGDDHPVVRWEALAKLNKASGEDRYPSHDLEIAHC